MSFASGWVLWLCTTTPAWCTAGVRPALPAVCSFAALPASCGNWSDPMCKPMSVPLRFHNWSPTALQNNIGPIDWSAVTELQVQSCACLLPIYWALQLSPLYS